MDSGWLFLDMNSFFASVEQQENPALRGKPVAVAPLLSDSTCVIAASYEAKPFGVKTGVNVGKARQMCPNITILPANPKIYIQYHQALIETVHTLVPDPVTLSVDEIACRLWANESNDRDAVRLAWSIKLRLRQVLGDQMRCSIGIAPNVFLAKVAAEIHKPNGLVLLRREDLPGALLSLSLRDLPGIGRSMESRLHAASIYTMAQFWSASQTQLHAIWGSVVGRRWWHMLRGSVDADYPLLYASAPRSVSNSHVLDPSLRTEHGAEAVMLRLASKATFRLRRKNCLARRVQLSVTYKSDRYHSSRWSEASGLRQPVSDLLTWLPTIRSMWQKRPRRPPGEMPHKVSIAFTDLVPEGDITSSLFEEDTRLGTLTTLMDSLNDQYRIEDSRANIVDLATVFWMQNQAPERIAFRKISDDDRERAGLEAERLGK